jgi:2-phosphoglycerate kinase
MMECSPDWKVLLIGGNSGSGKTVISRCLARRFGVGLAEVDDFRLVLERMTTPEQQPDLHRLLRVLGVGAQPLAPSRVVRDALIAVAQTVSHALEIVVANHVATDTPTILEGDGIVPAFAAQRVFAGREVENAVRAVFVIEEDKDWLLRNAVDKGRGFEQLPLDYQEHYIEVSWSYGQWLRGEAMHHKVPVIVPRPWETLQGRIIDAVRSREE